MWFVRWQDLPFMLSAGALVALYQLTFYASLPRTGVAIATVLALCSAPVMVAMLSAVIMRERLTGRTMVALTISLIGTVLLVNVRTSTARPDVVGGVLLALLAGMLYAINTLVGRKLGSGNRVHPLQTVTFGFGFGALILLAIALPMGLVLTYPTVGWVRLTYLGLIPTAAGYTLFFTGMRTTTATTASIATLLEPLTATLIAVLFLQESLSPQASVGGGLLMAAMLLLVTARS